MPGAGLTADDRAKTCLLAKLCGSALVATPAKPSSNGAGSPLPASNESLAGRFSTERRLRLRR
jgi:hypothetical protein